VKVGDTAVLDVLLGPADGVTGFKRCDVSIHLTSAGGLHIDVEVPPSLSASVGGLLSSPRREGR
jgi:hypothetical protein